MRVAQVWGVPLHVNEWLILLFFVYFLAGVGVQAMAAFLFVALHELGHVAAAWRLGFQVREVEFFPFGGVARLEAGLEQEPRAEMAVAIAGPLTNFLLMMALWSLERQGWLPVAPGWEEEDFYRFLMGVNFFLACFNLLPLLPLDGGRILRAWLAERLGVFRASLRAADYGQAGALVLGAVGIAGLYWNVTGLDIPLLAGFLFLGARKEKGAGAVIYMRFLTSKEKALKKSPLWPGEAVAARLDTPIADLLSRLSQDRCLIISVLDDSGRVVGQVSEGQVLEAYLGETGVTVVGDLLPK